jgi:hypothetical protein
MTWHNCLHTWDGYYAWKTIDYKLLIIKPLVYQIDLYYFDIAHIFVILHNYTTFIFTYTIS